MKQLNLTFITIILSTVCFAQVPEQAELLKFKGIKGDLGVSWDKYQNMSLDWMKARTNRGEAINQELDGMQEEATFFSSVGGVVGAELLFTAPSLGNDEFIPEVRFGLSANLGKEAIVSYNNNQSYTSKDYNSKMYCFVENETRISSEIVWRIGDTKKVTFYGGLGTNLSVSLGNELYIFDNYLNDQLMGDNNFSAIADMEVNSETHNGKSVYYQRLYVPIGIDLKIFRHLQGTIEYKVAWRS